MKKFKFTLQSVHNLRELREEREMMVLSQLNLEAAQASARLSEVENALVAAVEKYNDIKPGQPLNVVELELNSRHISALEKQKSAAREDVLQRQDACVRQVSLLTQAARDVKVTGKLRDNQVKVHRETTSRNEQTALDEMATLAFARNRGESR